MRKLVLAVTLLACPLLAGCGRKSASTGSLRDAAAVAAASHVLRLATTTSTRDSGLLDVLIRAFEKQSGMRVDVIAAGTGKALTLGKAGDVDVVLVHARKAEDAFMAAGDGTRREDVMYNRFEILGPPADPAGIRDMQVTEAMQRIAAKKRPFISRGDDSGTNKRELVLWQAGGGRPEWPGYIETGRGMGPTLIVADEMNGYVLADRGTFLALKKKIKLRPLAAPSAQLHNPYGIMVVNPKKNAKINEKGAQAFVDFIISPAAQKMIGDFRIEGEQLFHPLRLPEAKKKGAV